MMWKHVSSIAREHSRYEMQEWKYNYFTINFFKLSFKGIRYFYLQMDKAINFLILFVHKK